MAQLRAAYIAGRRDMPDFVADALSGSVAALLAVTLGDEALSSWQGGNMLNRRRVVAALEGSGARSRALRQARGWGYQRLQAKTSVLVFDGAPPPPSRALSGGCASTLAFEFSDGAHRLIVNCGGAGRSPRAAGRPRPGASPTAAHSTLTLGDRNSTAIHEDGARQGRRPGRAFARRDGGLSQVEGEPRRLCPPLRPGPSAPDHPEPRRTRAGGEDRLMPAGRKRRGEAVPFTVRFHLAPAVEVTSTADGQGRPAPDPRAARSGSSAAAAASWGSRTASGSTARRGRTAASSSSSRARPRRME
jgi:uncharacterized heparinase superfamily protein